VTGWGTRATTGAEPGWVLAHGIGGRQDLPVPFGAALAGATAALVVSFAVLALAWREPRFSVPDAGRAIPPPVQSLCDAPLLRVLLRAVGLAATGYVAVAAILGPDDALNPTAGVVYVLFWVGVPVSSVLLGPVWRLVNPLRTLHRGLALLLRLPGEGLRPVPARLGYWPAAISLLAFVWLELAAPQRDTTAVLRLFFALYAVVHLAAALVFGHRWFDRGDGFEVYSTLLGRLAVLGRRGDGRLVLRTPLRGLDATPPASGLAAVVCVLLGSTGYDGLSNAPFWLRLTQASGWPAATVATAGLLGAIGVVLAAYVGAVRAAARLAGRRAGRAALPGLFAHSVVPIALGYVVAHYYSLFVLESQRTVIRLSDPLGTGADLLGTADRGVDARFVTPSGVATLQVLAVVTGHVLGVVAAHDRAVREFPRTQALAGQLPLLVLMVGYTLAGLWLLFAG
jgi:hypothetical protein